MGASAAFVSLASPFAMTAKSASLIVMVAVVFGEVGAFFLNRDLFLRRSRAMRASRDCCGRGG